MEKSFLAVLLVIGSFAGIQSSWAQQLETGYCVFQVQGRAMLNDSIVLSKGMFIKSGHFLTLDEGDEVLLTDTNGVMYELKKKVIVPFARIKRYTKKEKQGPFSFSYLKDIWKKLWDENEKQGTNIVLKSINSASQQSPENDVSLFMREIPFVWTKPNPTGLSYFFLQEGDTKSPFTIATNGNTIVIGPQGISLKPDTTYYWSVASEPDPNPEHLEYYSFYLLGEESFNEKMKALSGVRLEFELLGLTEEQVKQTFCEDKGLCFE